MEERTARVSGASAELSGSVSQRGKADRLLGAVPSGFGAVRVRTDQRVHVQSPSRRRVATTLGTGAKMGGVASRQSVS